jgi:hypothetical protein
MVGFTLLLPLGIIELASILIIKTLVVAIGLSFAGDYFVPLLTDFGTDPELTKQDSSL